MSIKIYVDKVKVPGSKFEEYAVLSRLSGSWLLKKMRFLDPVVDDDGNVFPFIRKDVILFIEGSAVSASSLYKFLVKVEAEEYSEYPLILRVNRFDKPLEQLIDSLSRVRILEIRKYSHSVEVFPFHFEDRFGGFCNFLRTYDSELPYEDELVDF
jgi:hypothetical protein